MYPEPPRTATAPLETRIDISEAWYFAIGVSILLKAAYFFIRARTACASGVPLRESNFFESPASRSTLFDA